MALNGVPEIVGGRSSAPFAGVELPDPADPVGALLAPLPPPPPHAESANADTKISKQTDAAPFGVLVHDFTIYPAVEFFIDHVDFAFRHGIDWPSAPLWRQTAVKLALRIEPSITGNPAVVGRIPLDRWLCVFAFRRICLFQSAPILRSKFFVRKLSPMSDPFASLTNARERKK
jgi:hypothetical protein